MDWSRAVHHVEVAAEECSRIADLHAATVSVRVSQMWAYGAVLGPSRPIDLVRVAMLVDLPVADVAWMGHPPAAEHWLRMTRLPKNPVAVAWRSLHAPVWNHRIVRPLLVWDDELGTRDDAMDALRQGRGLDAGLAPVTEEQLSGRVTDELGVSLAAVRAATRAYEDRQWSATKLGPTADALWWACQGYLDLLGAPPATRQPEGNEA